MLLDRANLLHRADRPQRTGIQTIHAVWITVALTLLILSTLWYATASLAARRLLGGSSLPGLTLGILGGAIILFEFLLGWRKSNRVRRFGRVKTWMAGHIWLGLVSLPLILLHCGIVHWGGELTTILMVLMIVAVASGVYGLILQNRIPRMMLRELSAETIYSQIPRQAALNMVEADRLVLAVCGSPEPVPDDDSAANSSGQSAAHPPVDRLPRFAPDAENSEEQRDRNLLVSPETAAFLTVSSSQSFGNIKGRVVRTRAQTALLPEAEPLLGFYETIVRPYLRLGNGSMPAENWEPVQASRGSRRSRRPRRATISPLADPQRASELLAQLKTKLPTAAHEVVDRLADLIDQRRQFDRQAVLHRRLHSWLGLHLPVSTALVVLMFVHIYYAVFSW